MARWNIDTGAAATVLNAAGNEAQGYEGVVTEISDAFGAGDFALVNSPLVMSRLGEFAQGVVTPQVTAVAGHTSSALQGTTAAVNAYVTGDLEMAGESQRNATLAQYPALPGQGGR